MSHFFTEGSLKIQTSRRKRTIVSACDQETGQFLLIWVGWDKERWVHSILFHAQLIDGKVIIEKDLTEEGLKPILIEEGIPEEAFLSKRDRAEAERIAA